MTPRYAVTAARQSIWTNRKIIGGLGAVLMAIAGLITGLEYYISTRQSTASADVNQMAIMAEVSKGYVSREAFETAQGAQDSNMTQQIGYVQQTLGEVKVRVQDLQKSVNDIVPLLWEIKGQIGAKAAP